LPPAALASPRRLVADLHRQPQTSEVVGQLIGHVYSYRMSVEFMLITTENLYKYLGQTVFDNHFHFTKPTISVGFMLDA
jgi:hypothetical protein